jgi:putative transposase
MKRKQFTESQIVSALKQQEGGIAVKDIARDMGISEATFYNWKSKYGGMEASDVKRLKDLEAEHAELKKMYAELSIENRAMRNLIEKSYNACGETGSSWLPG